MYDYKVRNNIMKKKSKILTLILLVAICLIGCVQNGHSSHNSNSEQINPEWIPLSPEAEHEIVIEYAKALDEFAQVVPLFDDDTEAQWAADTVHQMALTLANNNYPFLQSLAVLSQMQNYTGYGMAYFNAIIGSHKNPELSDFALHIIPKNDSIYHKLEKAKFEDFKTYSLFNLLSIHNMQLFNALNRVINEQPVDDESGYTIYALNVLDSITCLNNYSDKEIFKISSVLESFSFFQMVCPLLKLFAVNKEKYDSNADMIIEAAKHFDSQSTPVFQ